MQANFDKILTVVDEQAMTMDDKADFLEFLESELKALDKLRNVYVNDLNYARKNITIKNPGEIN